MTVYVDEIRHYPQARWTRKHWCHLITDGAMDELHAFADALGVERRRLHAHRTLPHYDLTPELRERAVALGARPIDRRQLVELLRLVRARRRGEGRGQPAP
jgi:hypothetical protein